MTIRTAETNNTPKLIQLSDSMVKWGRTASNQTFYRVMAFPGILKMVIINFGWKYDFYPKNREITAKTTEKT